MEFEELMEKEKDFSDVEHHRVKLKVQLLACSVLKGVIFLP